MTLIICSVLLLFVAAEFSPALESTAWHMRHGSRFTQDEMSLTLPLSWKGDRPVVASSISASHFLAIPASLGIKLESVSIDIPRPCSKPADLGAIAGRQTSLAIKSGNQIVSTPTIQLGGQPAQCVVSQNKLFPKVGLTMNCERSDGVSGFATTYSFPNPTIEEMLRTADVPSCPQVDQ